MSNILQHLSGTKSKGAIFSSGLAQLEKTTGGKGVDTRLIADIIEKAHAIMRKLGLDHRDTTAHELYSALVASIKNNTYQSILLDSDYVLLALDDKIISFNLIDVIENAHHELKLEHQIISHGQRSLRGEIVDRYVNHEMVNEHKARDIASLVGLLPESDTWYNYLKLQTKQTIKYPKESK